MNFSLGKLFQYTSKRKDSGMADTMPRGDTPLNKDSNLGEHKIYQGFPSIPLPKPTLNVLLGDAVTKRVSVRTWSNSPLSLEDISNLLFYSCGTTGTYNGKTLHRAHASAGMKYPLEIYFIANNVESLKRAVYHYDSVRHTLTELWGLSLFTSETFENLFVQPEMGCASGYFVITALPARATGKYSERAYRYLYLEAGAIAHMLNVVGSTTDLGSIILGGVSDTNLETLLDIDGEIETVLITVAVGKQS